MDDLVHEDRKQAHAGQDRVMRAVISAGQYGAWLRLIDQNAKWRVRIEHNTTRPE
ncbi:MAG: hypothetical protein RBS80_26795 [Thermoguttaceae bacterium]|jgi:hypothetical protein|nr:hypothetical protein [Thermoguttaceae bacterium]